MGGVASTSHVEIQGSKEGLLPMLNSPSLRSRDQDDSVRRRGGLGVFSPCMNRSLVIDAQVEESVVEFDNVGEKLVGELSISFEYQCGRLAGHSANLGSSPEETDSISSSEGSNLSSHASRNGSGIWKRTRSSSFTCLSGAALSANATLANTTVRNNVIGDILLQGLDSPRTFRKLDNGFPHSNSMSGSGRRLSGSSGGSGSARGGSTFTTSSTGTFSRHFAPSAAGIPDTCNRQSSSAPVESHSDIEVVTDLQTAGGAAGEDRLQVVCSEENGVLFCGVYDGFNGRDAADFLAAHLYECIMMHLRLLIWQAQRAKESVLEGLTEEGTFVGVYPESSSGATFRQSVVEGLQKSVAQVEADFLSMVEGEMDERSDLAMVGSCILGVLIHEQDLYSINLGDSRAVLATTEPPAGNGVSDRVLHAVQLTEIHNADSAPEVERVIKEHPEDTNAILKDRVKGKLKVTRAFGAGYLKEKRFNNSLIGILRVRDLESPPYVSSKPFITSHRICPADRFVVLGSDGLFDFFSNEDVVDIVSAFMNDHPGEDPAPYMLEELLQRAADHAGLTLEHLKSIPIGKRRKYHDDVTIVIITLGTTWHTSAAST